MALINQPLWDSLKSLAVGADSQDSMRIDQSSARVLVAVLERAESELAKRTESALTREVAQLKERHVAMDQALLDVNPELKRERAVTKHLSAVIVGVARIGHPSVVEADLEMDRWCPWCLDLRGYPYPHAVQCPAFTVDGQVKGVTRQP